MRRDPRWMTAAAVVAIAAGALVVRLYNLAAQPGGLFPDEAAEGITGRRLLHEPGYAPFFVDDDAGREALYAYLVSFVFRFFGETTVTLRATSAILGVLAILGMGLALRRFGSAVALFAMLWGAGSLWLIAVSRDGMRNIICVSVGALIVAALLLWHDRPSRRTAFLAGAFVGLGLWTYQPLKVTPLLIVLWFVWMRRGRREHADGMLRDKRSLMVGFLIVAAPMIWTAITDPGSYFGRGLGTSVFNPDKTITASYPAHLLLTLVQFPFAGDPNPSHNVAGLPLLGPVLFALMCTGLWVCWSRRDDGACKLMLLGLPVFLLPPLIANEGGSPHFLRNLGLAPYIGGYIGLGCAHLLTLTRRFAGPGSRGLVAACLTLCLVLIGAAGFDRYITRPVSDLYDAYSYDLVTIAGAAHDGPGDLVILDKYNAMDIEFLDADNLPTIVSPGQRIAHPGAYSAILARSKSDIAHAAGDDIAARAKPIGWTPAGVPNVYAVVP
jgi:hypothetical protein